MSIAAKLRRAPLRITTGGFILNSGVVKLTSTDEDQAKAIHSMAAGAYPALERIKPRTFQKLVGAGECALGSVLLLPVFSSRAAGAGLLAFSAPLLGIYWRTPGMHVEGSIRPTDAGIALAKDSWMFGAGAALLLDGATESAKNIRDDSTPKLEEAKTALAAGAVSAAAAVASAAGTVKDTVKDKIAEAEAVAAEHAPQVKQALSQAGTTLVDKAQTVATAVADQTTSTLAETKERASEYAKDAADKASDKAAAVLKR